MSHTDLENTINAAWEDRDNVSLTTQGAVREAVDEAINLLDSGKARVAERVSVGEWTVKSTRLNSSHSQQSRMPSSA